MKYMLLIHQGATPLRHRGLQPHSPGFMPPSAISRPARCADRDYVGWTWPLVVVDALLVLERISPTWRQKEETR